MSSPIAYDSDDLRAPRGRSSRSEQVGTRAHRSGPAYSNSTTGTHRTPQAIVKVIGHLNGPSVQRCLDYIARTDGVRDGHLDERAEEHMMPQENSDKLKPVELERSDGSALHSKEEIKILYETWSSGFDQRPKGGPKGSRARHATHLVLSAKCVQSDLNRARVLAAAREVVTRNYGDKHDFVIGLHQDSANPHVHVLINCAPLFHGKKLRLGKPELLQLRKTFAQELSLLGLEHKATRWHDRKKLPLQEQVLEKLAKIKRLDRQHQRAMTRDHPIRNVSGHRARVREHLLGLREFILKETKMGSSRRRDALTVIRKFKRDFDSRNNDMSIKDIQATINFFQKEAHRTQKDCQIDIALSGRRLKRNKKYNANRIYDPLLGIESAMKDIRCTKGINTDTKKQALATLRKSQKTLSRMQRCQFER